MFFVKKLIALLLMPPLAPLIPICAGLLLLRWRPRAGRVLAWSGLVLALLVTTPLVTDALLDGLEDIPVLQPAQLANAGAIVILGGGARTNAPEFGGQTVNRLTLERVRYGARLARQSGLPMLVSGGAPSGSQPEAELMKTVLEEDFRLPVKWVEAASLDTRDNARMSAALLHTEGVKRVVLVTHAAHMRRSVEAFEAAGLAVIPAPTGFFRRGPADDTLPRLPNMNSTYAGSYAIHEWLGLLAYRLSR